MNIEVIHGTVCEMREARREESFEGNEQACAGETKQENSNKLEAKGDSPALQLTPEVVIS